MAKRDVLCLFDVDGTLTPSRLVRFLDKESSTGVYNLH